MSKKRVSYQNLLKEAIAEFDTSKTVDVKGPMLDPILQWDGQGELPIYKDAASILERYYFDETADKGVEVSEMEYNEDGTEGKTASEKDAKGAGTQQAGTSEKSGIPAEKKEIEKDLAKEAEEMEKDDDEEELEEKEFSGKDVPKAKKYVKEQDDEEEEEDDKEEEMEESADLTEDLENSVIEKLIAEMEEEDDEEEELDEMDMTYTGEGPKETMPKEKKATGPEEDAKGAGTEQAGTGTDAGQVPDRKDNADKMVKPKNYNEAEEMEKDEEEEELDVDKKVKEAASAVPGGPSPKKKGEDWDEDVYEEAFKIFKESIDEE